MAGRRLLRQCLGSILIAASVIASNVFAGPFRRKSGDCLLGRGALLDHRDCWDEVAVARDDDGGVVSVIFSIAKQIERHVHVTLLFFESFVAVLAFRATCLLVSTLSALHLGVRYLVEAFVYLDPVVD